ncbi:MAG: nuclear transport factor 2 family protein [Candidatus Bathyarchaeota archaeon]|nr:MAG: nuclear transport factor 2 family protein [Candidatus Bathyarchaeota archaeon]
MSDVEGSIAKADEAEIRELVTTCLKIMDAGDEEAFLEIWHPDARRFSTGNSNELNSFGLTEIFKYSLKGIKQLREENPESCEIQHVLDEVLNLCVYDNSLQLWGRNGT